VPRVPYRFCGATARVFRLLAEEGISASYDLYAAVVELSAATSAIAIAVSTVTMPDMNGFWREAASLKEALLRDQGSDVALRAIACGAFDPDGQYPFDAKTKKTTQFVASEILRQRQEAKYREANATAQSRERSRARLGWVDRLVSWTRMLLGI